MSRSKPNLGEPYQIYTEVMNVGKNVEGSKRKIRWLFGFTEKEGEIEVALIHSVTSGKKTIFEDGKEIVSSTNRLATDFGHTWRSETCQGRLFRVEFATSFTTDPTVYTFTVDGIKFIDMPKKGTIGGGGGGGGGASFANKNRSINGFGTGAGAAADPAPSHSHTQSQSHHAPASRAPSGTTSGFGQQSQPAPVASSSRRFVYDDDEEDTATSTAPKAHSTPAAAPRANFQSPFAPTNTATNAGFGFDPFDESPAPAPAAKPTATASLFDAFDEPAPQPKAQPQPAAKKASGTFDAFGSDPFANSSDPFASPAPAPAPQRAQAQGHAQPARATAAPVNKASPAVVGGAAPAPKSVPNFMDDDFSAAPVAPPAAQANNDFGNFGPATHTTPQRRSSAIEISNDFAGLTFAAPAPAPAPVMQQTPPPAPAPMAPAPEPVSNDPWSQSNLVNLDLSGNSKPVKRPSATAAGPSLSSMMHVAPTNSRASFTAGSPSAMAPAGGMSGGPHMVQPLGQSLQPTMGHQQGQGQGMYGQQPHQQQGLGMGLGAQQPMSMGGQPQMGMGQGMGGMNNAAPRASFNAGPMGGAPNGNMGAMGGGMQNTRGSFIAANPTPGMGGYGAPGQGLGQPAQPPKSSLDTLDWNF